MTLISTRGPYISDLSGTKIARMPNSDGEGRSSRYLSAEEGELDHRLTTTTTTTTMAGGPAPCGTHTAHCVCIYETKKLNKIYYIHRKKTNLRDRKITSKSKLHISSQAWCANSMVVCVVGRFL